MEENFFTITLLNKSGTTLGTEMLRDLLIPSLVGNNKDIMYWSGKLLARKLPLASKKDLKLFFKYAGWGDLKLIKSKKDIEIFELSGEPIKLRCKLTEKPDFKLETGFIAETYQLEDQFVTEGEIEKVDSKNYTVTINIHIDKHSSMLEEKTGIQPFSLIEFDKIQKEAQKIDSSNLESTSSNTNDNA